MNTNFLHDIRNLDKNVIAQDLKIINGHQYLVSTIFLKFNNAPINDMPCYYETKIFSVGKHDIYYNDPMLTIGHPALEDAEAFHQLVLTSLDNGKLRMVKGYFEFISD